MRYFLLIFFCCLTHGVDAQISNEFVRLGVNEGLSQNSVYALHQDEQGFMWIGTGDGLNRYDGKTFKIFRERWGDTSASNISGQIITSEIFQDKQQRLWFFTNMGLTALDKKTDRFIHPSIFPIPPIKLGTEKLLGFDGNEKLYLLSESGYINVLNTKLFQLKNLNLRGVKKIEAAVLKNDFIFFISKNILFSFSIKNHQLDTLGKGEHFLSLHPLSKNKIGINTTTGALIYHTVRRTFEKLPLDHFSQQLSLIPAFEYRENVYYFQGTGVGLMRYDLNTGEKTFFIHDSNNPSSLSNNYITVTYIDRSDNLWIGTEGGGLSKINLKGQRFKSFPSNAVNTRQSANLMVKSIRTVNDKILLGTFEKGLFVLDKNGVNARNLKFSEIAKKVSPPSTNFFYKDRSNRLWMNIGNAIGYIDTSTFQFKNYSFLSLQNNSIPGNFSIYTMAEIGNDEFVLGSNYGLHRMRIKNNQIQIYNLKSDSIFKGFVQIISAAPDGNYYIGKIRNGFWKVKFENQKIQILDNGFLNTGIRHFYFDKKLPTVWMASENGLIAYTPKTKKVRVFDVNEGLNNSYIYSILPENDTTLWVSTNGGLSRATIKYERNEINSLTFKNYTQVDGLQSNEFNTGAYYLDENNTFYFGGVNGINWFHPSEMKASNFVVPVVITGLVVNAKPYSDSLTTSYLEDLRLSSFQNTITISFAALDFTNVNANRFAYMLKGFDKGWTYNGTVSEARYANLPPGEYDFAVKATNSDGLWNEHPKKLHIIITPPWWQTIWFKVFSLMLAFAILFFTIHLYVRNKLRNKLKDLEKLQAVNNERLRISKDMHDELGTGLTKIALLTEVTKQELKNSDNAHAGQLDEIRKTSRALTEKMGEIIWTLDPQNDTLDNLAAYLKEQLYEAGETAGIHVATSYPKEIPAIHVTNHQRQQIVLVTREGFNNIIKHANAKNITFSLHISKEFAFTLEDDGKGFDPESIKVSKNGKRNGLNNMKWRMQQIGGSFGIYHSKSGGTLLEYALPFDS